MPHLRNPHFTGREELLNKLQGMLTNGRVALTAVRGMGGVGKTQLAVEYAYRHSDDFDVVWWLRAEEPVMVLEDYGKLAGPLGLAQAGESELAAVAAAVCQELTTRTRWLLVFDNAGEPDVIESLLPKARGGGVLVTSRNPFWPFAGELDVPILTREAAVTFLLARTGQNEEKSAALLAHELGDLPLALEQAAAYITETGSALADYLSLLQTRRRELWSQERSPAGYPATVGTTWTMAVDRLRKAEPRAVDLLNLCAFLAPEAIARGLLLENHETLPPELDAAVADPLRLNRLLGALRRYSLIELTSETLAFHRLIQAATRDALDPVDRQRWSETAVALIRAAFPYNRDDPRTWAASGALLAHALAAAGHAEETAADWADARWLLNQTAQYFETRAEFDRAKAGYARALALAEAAVGPSHPEVAAYVTNLGSLLKDLGDLPGARAAFERALRIGEASLGPDHPDLAPAVNNLGAVLRALGDLPGARTAFERALAISERFLEISKASFGPDHPKVANCISNLGEVLQELGDLVSAKAAFERALEINQVSLGPDHPKVAMCVNNLGFVLRALGDLLGARAAFERALRIDETSLGPDHPKLVSPINNLGSVLRALGDLTGARAAFERALRIDEANFGPDHVNVARDVNNLGLVLQALGDLSGARAAHERALRIDEASFGPEHFNVARDLNNLGLVLQALEDLTGARAAFQRALRIDQASFGPNHPRVATNVNNLAAVLRDLGDLTGARTAFEHALRIDEASFGLNHPKVATGVNNLGALLQDLGDLPGARSAFERALAIFEHVLGPDNPRTRIVRRHLEGLGGG